MRTLLSAGLRGTLSGIIPTFATLTPATQDESFVATGKLNGVEVNGEGFFYWTSPPPYPSLYDQISFSHSVRSSFVNTRVASAPVSSGNPSGPMTLEVQVYQATGKFRADLNTFATVTIVKKVPTRGHPSNLVITFQPG